MIFAVFRTENYVELFLCFLMFWL